MKNVALLLLILAACGGQGATDPSTPVARRDGGASAGRDGGSTAGGDASAPLTCHAQASPIGGRCVCNTGYQGDGTTCQDVDECAGDHGCAAHSTCGNEEGSYSCFCDGGFEPMGTECVPIQCAPCSVDGRCPGGRDCRQRYCDGRFGCYGDSTSCGEIGGAACTASGAWEACATSADCPAEHHPSGRYALRFVCHAFDEPQARCWPIYVTGNGQVEPPPATERLECPPAPPGTMGLTVTKSPERIHYEWDPPPMEGGFHLSGLQTCHLSCAAGDTCPTGMRCLRGQCK